MEMLLKILGQNVFGSLWTTVPGSMGVFVLFKPVLQLIEQGKTFGEIITSSEFVGLMFALNAIISPDPHKGRK